jgi:nucleotide-binding universal stress UspA family protein
MNLNHILIPVDFSEHTQSAISAGLDLAGKSPAKITLLHVLQVLYPEHLQPIFGYEKELKAFEVETEKKLRELAGTIASLANVEIAMEGGVAWEKVVEYAERHEVDLIVMPTHGRSGLKHLWLGSVAERVVQHAPCNVMIVRTATVNNKAEPQNPEGQRCHSGRSASRTPCACASEKRTGEATTTKHPAVTH